ncbi:MAG: GHKL domain-containing protein [Sedimentibacter sp.]|uniref:sensor histidine kinase n=1 Tax=Sedimentibacter sp. TaxID=1960295 RepID=UPI003158ACBC
MTNNVIIVYLITNVFSTYTIYRFMAIFFDCRETDRRVESISYIMYFFVNSLLFIAFNNMALNVASNLVMFFLLTYNYEATFRTRLIASVSIYTILMIIETLVVLIMGYFDITVMSMDRDLPVISGMISIKILSYTVMLFLSNFKMVKNNINVSYLHWLSIFVIPAGTLVSALMLITEVHSENIAGMIVSIVILFVINVFVFYFYDALMRSYDEKMEKVLLQQQNSAYLKQLEVINQSQENLRVLRHDIKNHVMSLKSLMEREDCEGMSDYLATLSDYINYSGEYSKTGNAEIDSIINYKMDKAKLYGIKTEINLSIPEKLNIRPFDLSVVFGNLLDNAIEGASRSKTEKMVKVSAELENNVLYINIANTYDGNLNYKNGRLETSSEDKQRHGLGLVSVKKSLENYNGTMSIRHSKGMFYVDVLIYNSAGVQR